ncbi:unnamed protein product [Cuscuta epithymum]|uniref:Uncharacterized protein n=1 Tax=Cuscuta epithymum TaxID=186058 RepID=A0AAV0D098_9ASTE|nr:unnamed protein product [Cuscuta epithymum]CAH9124745.1 unnamed protein product [Cuscuta epithymum]
MDIESVKRGLSYYTRKNKKWVFALGILGFTSYSAYRSYNSPAMVKRRQRFLGLFGSLASLAEMASNSANTISILSKDLNEFIQSDSDQVPPSIRQISKIVKSEEVSESLVRITASVTAGVLQGCQNTAGTGFLTSDSGFGVDRVLDKLFTDAGSGFASAVVGSFANNLVTAAFYSDSPADGMRWVNNVLYDEKCREIIENCVQLSVSTAVSVYLEKTMNTNTFGDIFSALTNPKHEAEVRDILVTLCQHTVETFIRTSHQVLSNNNQHLQSNVLARNTKFILDLTKRLTFETMKSFQEFVQEQVSESLRRRAKLMHEKEEALEEYVRQKSSTAITAFLTLCLHIVNSPWLLVQ